MRILVTTVIVIVFVYAALALYAYHIKKTGMFFPDRYPAGSWTPDLPVRPEDFFFTTPDGVKLHAWFFRATAPGAPVMIYFHGNAGHLAYRGPFAAELATRGLSVFVFDYRGYGRSEGRPSEAALHIDSLRAYDFVRTTLESDPQRIALFGESVGAPYAARVATQRPACCIVVQGSFPSLRRLGNELFRPIPMGLFAGELLLTTRWLNSAGRPVLLMHAKHDEVIPFRLGMEVYEQLNVEKELFVSESGHNDMEAVEGERLYTTIVGFIQRHATGSLTADR